MSDDVLAFPVNPIGMVAELAQELWYQAMELANYDSDYISHIQTFHKKNNPKCKKIEFYEKVADSIDEDFGEFTNNLRYLLARIYHNYNRILSFKEKEPELYAAILEGIGLLECVHTHSDEMYIVFIACLGFYGDVKFMEEVYKYSGVSKKHFKKKSELTVSDYEFAFDKLSNFFIHFLERHKSIPSELEIFAGRLFAYCKRELGENWNNWKLLKHLRSLEKGIEGEAVTIRTFLKNYCDSKNVTPIYLEHWRKCLNNENSKGNIRLPQLQDKNWFRGRAHHYFVKDLQDNWPQFRKKISSLPPLK